MYSPGKIGRILKESGFLDEMSALPQKETRRIFLLPKLWHALV
jgi:hypothetical protein